MPSDLFYQIVLTRPGNLPSRVFDFLTDLELPHQLSASATRIGNPDAGDWRIMWLLTASCSAEQITTYILNLATAMEIPDLPILHPTDLTILEIPDCNWLERSYAGFQPFAVGRFHLRGRHDETVGVPDGLTGIMIDAVTAFGSGEHPTTRGCLMLLDDLAAAGCAPDCVLDLGTGSGILAIAAHKLWPQAAITAVDNDPESVRVAAEYAGYNDVPIGTDPGQMSGLLADTPASPSVSARGPFDLIIANILAGPLRDLAAAIADTLAPNGTLILSGLLESQIDDVMGTYTPLGFKRLGERIIIDWAAIALTR